MTQKNDLLTKEGLQWIVESLLNRAQETVTEADYNQGAFYDGKILAYYEMLDIIKSRIIIREGEPKEYGLDFDLEQLEQELKKRVGDKNDHA